MESVFGLNAECVQGWRSKGDRESEGRAPKQAIAARDFGFCELSFLFLFHGFEVFTL